MTIDEIIQSRFESSQMRALVNLRYTSNFLSMISNSFMAKYELTMPQFNILRILRGAGAEMAVNTIKERMVEKSPNTTRLMDKLIAKGLISRARCEDDRRVVFVKITPQGLALLAELDVVLKQVDIFPCHLSEQEADMLSELLDKLRG
jgi:DNA-binding MarR family transcriptional regulator